MLDPHEELEEELGGVAAGRRQMRGDDARWILAELPSRTSTDPSRCDDVGDRQNKPYQRPKRSIGANDVVARATAAQVLFVPVAKNGRP